jgi:hypothetical protein
MGDNLWIKIVGCIVVFIPVIETLTGVAWEKTGLVRRSEKPGLFWLSVFCKLAVGIAILNLEYLQSVFGR